MCAHIHRQFHRSSSSALMVVSSDTTHIARYKYVHTLPLQRLSPQTHTSVVILSHALNITVDISSSPFVVTEINVGGLSSQQVQYNFYDVDGVPLGAVVLTDTDSGLAAFAWRNGNGTWIIQTSWDMNWEYGRTLYWFLYGGTFQYGFEDGGVSPSWLQAGLLVTPWISEIFSTELVNVHGSNATVVSIQPIEDVLGNMVACYNCSAVPLPMCFPISWPPQLQTFYYLPVNDSDLWFLRLTPSPSGLCPYYFTFSFGSISVGVNITIHENYTFEVTILGNAYQPEQLVYSILEPSQGVIPSQPLYVMWGICITLSPESSVAVQFPCLTSYGPTLTFFVHNVSIPLVEQNAPSYSLSVVAGANVSDVSILTFTPAWSLSGLCG